jgi:hypothetical protein
MTSTRRLEKNTKNHKNADNKEVCMLKKVESQLIDTDLFPVVDESFTNMEILQLALISLIVAVGLLFMCVPNLLSLF